eukprot:TRINITY_DN26119_c1_g2_i1.p1 TRINITY_DN26119_c1_g2~~TRINITY_DN26119_c1_g2_i1.p1  ORF type:complete len:906 (-),score=299.53 TRINITY_DN26119_c1_g2_i1:86-2803(-)
MAGDGTTPRLSAMASPRATLASSNVRRSLEGSQRASVMTSSFVSDDDSSDDDRKASPASQASPHQLRKSLFAGSGGGLGDSRRSTVASNGGKDAAGGSPAIKVCVRLRPFIKEDEAEGRHQLCVGMPSEQQVQLFKLRPDGSMMPEPERTFDFDRVYWSHSKDHQHYATQETLMDEVGEAMLEGALAGFNNCIFAYGQTGSGKSFSVLGGEGENRGLLPRVVEGLFEQTGQLPEGTTAKTLVAFMEIYNEQVKDLLTSSKDQENLQVKTHPVLGTIIPGLTKAAVGSCEEVLTLVEYGTSLRKVSATAMNATSSRSHCIFTFELSIANGSSGTARHAHTHLVDLAGSERAGRTKAQGDRLKEGTMINKSLSTLARVISELAKNNKKSNPPFRDSKLTFILKESLCGNSKTVMMAAISPSIQDFDETLSTLKFAQGVKQVQTCAVVNQVNEKGIEAQLRAELEDLRAVLEEYQQEKNMDARRLSTTMRRLKEQEQLVAQYNSQQDFETLLAEERGKSAQRTERKSLFASDIMDFQDAQRRKSMLPDDSDSAASRSADGESDDDDQVVLVHLQHDVGAFSETVKGTDTVSLTPKSQVKLCGPAAKAILKEGAAGLRARAEGLSKALEQLQECTASAQKAANLLSDPSRPRLRLRAAVAVDVQELTAELVVRCWRTTKLGLEDTEELQRSGGVRRGGLVGKELSQSFNDESDDVDSAAVWLITETELQSRLAWLEEQLLDHSMAEAEEVGAASAAGGGGASSAADTSTGAGGRAPPFEDAWDEARRVVGSCAQEDAQGSSGGSAPTAAAAAAASAAHEAEVKALRAELAEAKARAMKAEAELKGANLRLGALEQEWAKRENPFQLKAGGFGTPNAKARNVAMAIASSFESAIAAIDAAQVALEKPLKT